jgi:hypothetical protein
VGEAVVISGGKAGRVRVERLLPPEDLLAAAAEIVTSHGATKRPAPIFHPSPPPPVPGL